MIRLLAFSAALRGTAALSWLVPQAFRFTRWLAPAGIRRDVDLRLDDAELVEACGAVARLSVEIEAAWDARNEMVPGDGAAFERTTLDPLVERRRQLVATADDLRARTVRGHQARARMIMVACGWQVEAPDEAAEEVDPSLWALVRDLAA